MPYAKPDLNYWIASALFMACSKTGEARETHDLLLIHCGFPGTPFNRALLKSADADLDDVLERSRVFFAEPSLPYELTLRSDEEERFASRLEERGFTRSGDPVPVMTFDLEGRADRVREAPQTEGLTIEKVMPGDALTEYAATAFGGFELPAPAAPLFIGEQLLARPEVTCLLGRVGGEPVTTSMVVQTGDVTGIYWVATLPDHRGRGLGEAMTWAAMRAGAEQGGRLAILQASKMGRPVYARMGFDEPYAYVGWAPPAESTGRAE